MKAYNYDHNTKKFKGEINCQIDPLESKIAGKTIYLLPGDSTYIEPLVNKDGYDIVFTGDGWEYKEQPKPVKPEPYVPTEREKLEQELWEYQDKLDKMDYIGTKIATKRGTIEEYADKIALMSEYADKINELREKIKVLETEEAAD